MKIAILKCHDCGAELNRTTPFPDKYEGVVRVGSAFAAGNCPNGCRSTLSDLNINTDIEVIDAPDNPSAREKGRP